MKKMKRMSKENKANKKTYESGKTKRKYPSHSCNMMNVYDCLMHFYAEVYLNPVGK